MLVSDRAKALIKLGDKDYLNCPSMPDLFHFQQTLARKAGTVIGRAWKKAAATFEQKKKDKVYYSQRKAEEDRFYWQDNCRRRYRKAIEQIHKAVHAFDENGRWHKSSEIRHQIGQGIIQVEQALINSRALHKDCTDLTQVKKQLQEDGLTNSDIEKLTKQIPGMLKGIQHWQQWTQQGLQQFVVKSFEQGYFPQATKSQVQSFLFHYLLPFVYWQVMRSRLSGKAKDKQLRIWYDQRVSEAHEKLKQAPLMEQLTEEQYSHCYHWATRICRSFQRASSQVEGRNGHLTFIHKANRGLTQQRLKVLTVVHNFDIRGTDNKTPAERLFQSEFPDLFEFILEDVTGFAEPRLRKHKPLIVNTVRA